MTGKYNTTQIRIAALAGARKSVKLAA